MRIILMSLLLQSEVRAYSDVCDILYIFINILYNYLSIILLLFTVFVLSPTLAPCLLPLHGSPPMH